MLSKAEHIKLWKEEADNDLRNVYLLFEHNQYKYGLFTLHLSIEKYLKAVWIADNKQNIPPRIHNLLTFSNETLLSISDEEKILLTELTRFNISGRYHDEIEQMKPIEQEYALNVLKLTEDLLPCLLEKLPSR